ncbi:MAG TPA: hypothetical protein VNZ22_05230, partial [Bacillota bacterium]|nr:hypothetical protein [Bacillota bacterium]
MGVFSRHHFAIRLEAPGRLSYQEGNQEYVFPVFEEADQVVIAAYPSRYRQYLFLGWYKVPKTFPPHAAERIFPRLLSHFQTQGQHARLLFRDDEQGQAFAFHPELFEHRDQATELLEGAGLSWFSDYSSIDLLHEEYGLEVCGIRQESHIEPTAHALQAGFPHWHFHGLDHSDSGREPGWE